MLKLTLLQNYLFQFYHQGISRRPPSWKKKLTKNRQFFSAHPNTDRLNTPKRYWEVQISAFKPIAIQSYPVELFHQGFISQLFFKKDFSIGKLILFFFCRNAGTKKFLGVLLNLTLANIRILVSSPLPPSLFVLRFQVKVFHCWMVFQNTSFFLFVAILTCQKRHAKKLLENIDLGFETDNSSKNSLAWNLQSRTQSTASFLRIIFHQKSHGFSSLRRNLDSSKKARKWQYFWFFLIFQFTFLHEFWTYFSLEGSNWHFFLCTKVFQSKFFDYCTRNRCFMIGLKNERCNCFLSVCPCSNSPLSEAFGLISSSKVSIGNILLIQRIFVSPINHSCTHLTQNIPMRMLLLFYLNWRRVAW